MLNGDGEVRPAVELEAKLRRETAEDLDALGMTPRSRAKLGRDLDRGLDLASTWAHESGHEWALSPDC